VSTKPATTLAVTVSALQAEVADLKARMRVVEQKRRPHDSVRDARFVSEIALTFDGQVFTAEELHDLAPFNPGLREVLDGASRPEIGAWLRHLRRHPTGKYTLHRLKRAYGGFQWQLDVCPDIHTHPGLSRSAKAD